jgi:CheY-like chemotaxis protein
VVEDDEVQRAHIAKVIGDCDVKTTCVATGQAALRAIKEKVYDALILDLGLPDLSGLDVLEEIRKIHTGRLPVLVYTAKDLTKPEMARLKLLAESIIVKTPDSAGQLFDETSMFLHRIVADLPEEQQKLLAGIRQREPLLSGRKVLIVDDDVRNIFSLASALEQHQMQVLHAENGRDGIAMLERTPGIDCVLMDIMMPDMDGYETIRTIRARDRFKALPIVAITAKAMKGDREKCLEAGASDYAAKPVDMDQILSIIRVWLRKH